MRIQSPLASTLLTLALALGACKKADDHADHAPAPATEPPKPSEPVEAKPHGDHGARHGGVVMMTAESHLEAVLGADGKHRIYWSDNARDALPASTYEKVSITIVRPGEAAEEIALAKDAKDEAWEGQGKPLAEPAKADITVNYNKPGQPAAPPQKIVFPEAHAEAAGGDDHAASGEHEHKSPHGGLVASTTGGHLELLATPDGAFKLWLLDEKLASRPVAGVTASVKVGVVGYADVPLAVVGDHLEGKGAAIGAEHAPAVVTVKVADRAETARFTLHLEKEGHSAAPEGAEGHEHHQH